MTEKTPRAQFLGERLRQLAAARGVSKHVVHTEANVAKSALYKYFAGKALQPDAFQLVRLARYFGVTTDYLLGTQDDNVEASPTELATVSA